MDINELKQHIDRRLDQVDSKLVRMEEKQDRHLDRISSAEASIKWLRGTVKFGASALLAIMSGLVTLVYNTVLHK